VHLDRERLDRRHGREQHVEALEQRVEAVEQRDTSALGLGEVGIALRD
jgi:hypothetical protein